MGSAGAGARPIPSDVASAAGRTTAPGQPEGGQPMSPTAPWGTHLELVRRYEEHLLDSFLGPGGRVALAESIGSELTKRGVTRLLDCAAGTGFPALDLIEHAADLGLDEVHVCDGDPVMVRELLRQAKSRRIAADALNPRRRPARTPRQALDDLVINWSDLNVVRGTYEYVMCRGNSLVYADTWTGLDEVTTRKAIRRHMSKMAERIEPGGYLHVDGPWKLAEGARVVLDSPGLRITEEVRDQLGCREWRLAFTHVDDHRRETPLLFRRLSSPLTIHDVHDELRDLGGFEDTEPFQMEAERLVFGTIIARKVR